ncbi:MAG: InlB B-repeat-containing protein [Clostridiales bacterium]|nr:InlB B-repeat-containing protein [Clostridiales bacterium]
MRVTKKTSSIATARRARRGFTLVELIVVLTILAILAAIGVASAVRYIDRSRFEENSQSAVTVYQAAQTAISQKIENGTISSWVEGLNGFSPAEISYLNNQAQDNLSVHHTVALTYNPNNPNKAVEGTEDKKLHDLLTSCFYDQTIFSGTISVVFDVSATYGNGTIYYSANVISAFYSKQNNATTGWQADFCNHSGHEGYIDEEPWKSLPCTDYNCRRDTTRVGYFNGLESSIVGSVVLPQADSDLVADVTLRNSETLDINWVVFSSHSSTDEFDLNFYDNIGSGTDPLITITVDEKTINDAALTQTSTVYERVTMTSEGVAYDMNITRTSRQGVASFEVTQSDGTTVTYEFPVTKTTVTGDARASVTEYANPMTGYTVYTLSLDCMMTRNDYQVNADAMYDSSRLFANPTNIYAELVADGKDPIVATRAIDDPVHFTGVERVYFRDGGHTAYCYNLNDGQKAGLDTDDRCVVNTLFGDLQYGDDLNGIRGSFAGAVSNNQTVTAIITSYRHLSNIRRITDNNNKHHFNYLIARDLNWYIPGTATTMPVSEVKVFASSTNSNRGLLGYTGYYYHSPVENGSIRIVSFPAIQELKGNAVLSAAVRTDTGTGLYSINNVQMRLASFWTGTDQGYGLICKNLGKITNIVTNSLNLVMVNVTDGSANDYGSICPNSVQLTETSVNRPKSGDGRNKDFDDKPIGGLVGLNQGTVGIDNDAVIIMNNPIVMGGRYWSIMKFMKGIGGVIGKNEGNNGLLNGTIEVNGSFAIVGHTYVGGIIGHSKTNTVNARFIVNGANPADVPASNIGVLPRESNYTSGSMSCSVVSWNTSAGAIGYLENAALTYNISNKFASVSNSDADTGSFSFINQDNFDYIIDVTLPTNSLLISFGNGSSYDVNESRRLGNGGAVGYMRDCNVNNVAAGEYVSIRVHNYGKILIATTNLDTGHPNVTLISSGGAVGRDENSRVDTVFVNVINEPGSQIGNVSSHNILSSCGGAYGYIEGSEHDGRTYAVSVINRGTYIRAEGGAEGYGAGGAVGGIGSDFDGCYYINVNNALGIGTAPRITDIGDHGADVYDGAGGAIGSMYRANSSIMASSVIYAENHGSVTGDYHVGGAIGNASSNLGKIYSNNVNATISGNDFIGGAIGYELASQSGTVQSILANTTVSGADFIGGAAGSLQEYNAGSVTTVVNGSSSVIGTGSFVGGVCGETLRTVADATYTSVTLKRGSNSTSVPSLTVTGGGSSIAVGGAVGMLRAQNCANYCNVTMPSTEGIIFNIDGGECVGGAVGEIRSSTAGASHSSAESLAGDIKAYDEYVKVDVVLRSESHIIGTGANVGGAVGLVNSQGAVYRESISVTAASGTASGTGISGSVNVGGAVGLFSNCYPSNSITVDISAVSAPFTISSTASDASVDANLGGAIGIVSCAVDGDSGVGSITVRLGVASITATGSNVGGAIGKNNVSVTSSSAISVTYGGAIRGSDRVGGAIGYNLSSVGSISSSGTGSSSGVIGNECVGGAVGLTENSIAGISVTLSGDNAVVGKRYVGGALGRVGTSTDNPTISSVSVEVNTGKPVSQSQAIGVNEDAFIGGAIGQVLRGTVASISISGSGANVNPYSVNPSAPNRSVPNSMLVSGAGRSIGGIIGQIGDENSNTGAVVNDITVADSIGICVVSTSGSEKIGGWIGSCYGQLTAVSLQSSTYSVKTVKVVYSSGEAVGGFCGIVRPSADSLQERVSINGSVSIVYSGASVTGLARVGGAIGEVSGGAKLSGSITVDLDQDIYGNFTSIGDYQGNTSDISLCFCIEAGGAVGYLDCEGAIYRVIDGKVEVNIKKGSRVFAGGTSLAGSTISSFEIAGVGGAYGRVGSIDNTVGPYVGAENSTVPNDNSRNNNSNQYLIVTCDNANSYIYSARSNVGGSIGHLIRGYLSYSRSTAIVVGGGSGPNGLGTGQGCTGGLIGRADNGHIENCIVGGHTSYGQYMRGEENISGLNYVGGFIGYSDTGINAIDQCYTTASVRGDSYVGGFAGYIHTPNKKGALHQTYSTGLVTIIGTGNNTGAYAGFIDFNNNWNSIRWDRNNGMFNYALTGVNSNMMPRVGNIDESELDSHDDGRYIAWAIPSATRYDTGSKSWTDEYGNTHIYYYIRNRNTIYTVHPLDPTLTQNGWFPFRTFMGNDHYGDWPVIDTDHPNLSTALVDLMVDGNMWNAYDEPISVEYSGSNVTIPNLQVLVNGVPLDSDDYILNYSNNLHVGTAVLNIVGRNNYTGVYGPRQITIIPRDIHNHEDEFTVTLDVPDGGVPYTGSPITPEVTVEYAGNQLRRGEDYVLRYSNNTNVSDGNSSNPPTVTIVGHGDYTGEIVRTFTIAAPDLSGATITVNGVYTYDGTSQEPTVSDMTVVYNGITLEPNTDYEVTGYEDNTNAGTARVFISGLNNYFGSTATGEFAISPADISSDEFTASLVNDVDAGLYYDQGVPERGSAYEPAVTVTRGTTDLDATSDYTVVYDANTAHGTATVTITGTGNYTGVRVLTFRILELFTVTFNSNEGSAVDDQSVVDGGYAAEPTPAPTRNGYTLLFWYEHLDESGNPVAFDFANTAITGNTTLYAEWGGTITFVTNGGTSIDPQAYRLGEIVTVEPTRDEYVFDGWFTDEGLTTPFTSVDGDTTLYARWVHTVTLVYGEDTGIEDVVQRVAHEGYATVPSSIPTWEGHTFSGWYDSAAGGTVFDFTNQRIMSNCVIYAHWDEQTP